LKAYKVDIYGRKNSIVRSIQGLLLFGCTVNAENERDAREQGWTRYQNYGAMPWPKRNDVRIEVEPANEHNSLAVLLGKKLLPRR